MFRPIQRPGRLCRGLLIGVAVSACLTAAPTLPAAAATTSTTVSQPVDQPDESPDATSNDFLDLERSLSECISSNPPPGCGRAPTSPGDRGGWQQLVLFGVMMGGVAVIFWRISRAVRSRDESMTTDRTTNQSSDQTSDKTTK